MLCDQSEIEKFISLYDISERAMFQCILVTISIRNGMFDHRRSENYQCIRNHI